MKIVVIGGSGLIGSKLVAQLGETRFDDWLSRPANPGENPRPAAVSAVPTNK